MARFHGMIGFSTRSKSNGIVTENIVEREYYGDVTRNSRRMEHGSQINDNMTVSNTISIVADPYANENFTNIRYVVWMNSKWKVNNIDVEYPRLVLTIGGVWNGQ